MVQHLEHPNLPVVEAEAQWWSTQRRFHLDSTQSLWGMEVVALQLQEHTFQVRMGKRAALSAIPSRWQLQAEAEAAVTM